mgnify:CR=1 FL=1
MKIALASDLHLEFGAIELHNTESSDVLVLAGDICTAKHLNGVSQYDQRYRTFFAQCCERFPKVIYVLGNHESYAYDIQYTASHLKRELARDNLHILDNETVDIDGVTFIGTTLWTDMNAEDSLTLYHVSSMMNDFQTIKNSARMLSEYKAAKLTPEDTVEFHKKSLDYINHVTYGRPNYNFVVVGHHCPSHKSVHEKYKNDTLMNGNFYTNMDEFIIDNPQIQLWIHGHMHDAVDYMLGTTRVVSNPRGYLGYEDTSNFKPDFGVDLDL